MRRETDLNEKDVDLISPSFLTRHPGSGDNPDSNPQSIQSLVSSWSQLDSGTNSRLEELRVAEDEEEELLPCQGSTGECSDKNDNSEKVSESLVEACDNDINNCDNNGYFEENVDKESLSYDEEEEEAEEAEAGSEAGSEVKKKKNKKRRKHAKKKPKGVTITTAETVEIAA